MKAQSLLTLFLVVAAAAPSTQAQDRRIQRLRETEAGRHALIVGNDAYRRSPLVNAANDAHSMEATLSDMGFSVETVVDAGYPTFDRAVDIFVDRLGPGDVALFYYAGHGVQVDGRNYLIPVDFERSGAAKVKYRALPADLIRERMESSGARLTILILDACRDNPFHGSRSAGAGLAQMETGIGTFIAFSTAPGRTAADNPSADNGLFTHHLIRTLRVPGLSIDEVFNEVRREVYEASERRQVPWTASSMIGSFYFRPAPKAPMPTVAVSRRRATGRLDVTVNMGGAAVYLDGDRVATSEGAETLRLDAIPIGDYVVRVSRASHQDVVRSVRIEPGATIRLDAWLEAEPFGPPARPRAAPASLASNPNGAFCDTLEQVLSACPGQFRDLVVPSRSQTRTFFTPTVAFSGAWYNKVFRASPDAYEYLSSFETDLGGSPALLLDDFVSQVEACLPSGAISWHKRRSTSHQLQVALDPGPCQVDVALSGENVELEIYQAAR